jgi:sigma-E factor negative regulatory protein RseB
MIFLYSTRPMLSSGLSLGLSLKQCCVAAMAVLCSALSVAQQSISLTPSPGTPAASGYRDPLVETREMSAYIDRLQAAANTRNFTGIFTVMSSGAMSSSRISHYVMGGEVYEQIELLDGARRTQLRHNDSVHVLMPEQRLATVETRPVIDGFPKLLKGEGEALAQLYELSYQGNDRVAGYPSRVAQLKARDHLRFGQRLWTDEKSGLLLKSQVIGANGEVLEQVAFTEVAVNMPPAPERVKQAFKQTLKRVQDFHVMALSPQRSNAQNEGWRLNSPVAGFREVACFKRGMSEGQSAGRPTATAMRDVMQWVFSDGLANVSVFVERYQPEFHGSKEMMMGMGATHSMSKRMVSGNNANWWVTVMGEVPPATLMAFAQALERSR